MGMVGDARVSVGLSPHQNIQDVHLRESSIGHGGRLDAFLFQRVRECLSCARNLRPVGVNRCDRYLDADSCC